MTHAKTDHLTQGILLILASVFAMAFGDAMIKLISADLSLWQVFIARSVFAIACLLLPYYLKKLALWPENLGWVSLRSLLLVLSWLAYYSALPMLDFSLAAVVLYINPILTTLFSAVFLSEKVSPQQWLGVALGFAGVIVIQNPGGEAFSWYILLPFFGAIFYSLAMVLTRNKCQSESAGAMAFSFHLTFLMTGSVAILALGLIGLDASTQAINPFLLSGWITMDMQAWGVMALLGVLSAGFVLGVARAYQIAPPQIIASFDYGYLVSAALWGIVIFGEKLALQTVFGMILITLGGLLVGLHSAKLSKKKPG